MDTPETIAFTIGFFIPFIVLGLFAMFLFWLVGRLFGYRMTRGKAVSLMAASLIYGLLQFLRS